MTLKRKYHKVIHKFCITEIAPQRWGKTYILPKYCRTIPPILACVHTHKQANGKII